MGKRPVRPVRLFGRFSTDRGVDRALAGIASRIHVFVDGDRYQRTVAFDTIEGWLEHYALNDAGKPIVLDRRLVRRRVSGHVVAAITHLTIAEAQLLEQHGKQWQLASSGAGL